MTLDPRRHALYDRLPFEVAELVRQIRVYGDHLDAGEHECAASQLGIVRDLIDEVRKWEDRQLRIKAGVETESSPPKRQRKQSEKVRLYLVTPDREEIPQP